MAFSPKTVRAQFPILQQAAQGHPLVYLDTAATAHAPQVVHEAMQQYYDHAHSNVHRSMHVLAERATIAYESARCEVQRWLGAAHSDEIIFTKNCTEALNLVARSWAEATLQPGDAVVLTLFEHHSNIVPWLQLQERRGIQLFWLELNESGGLRTDQLEQFLAQHPVKLVSITGQSNVTGFRPDLAGIIRQCHNAGALVCIDAAQLIVHCRLDVQALGCDFLAFSGHKLYGPTGIGVLYGKQTLLRSMPPFLGGGSMIQTVSRSGFSAADPPQRFEAGTPPIAEAVGLAAASRWISQFSQADQAAHEAGLLAAARKELSAVRGLSFLPVPTNQTSGCLSFTLEGVHPHDLTEVLGRQGICLRAGHHCAQPLHQALGIVASTRLSVGIYNTVAEIDGLGRVIEEAKKKLAVSG